MTGFSQDALLLTGPILERSASVNRLPAATATPTTTPVGAAVAGTGMRGKTKSVPATVAMIPWACSCSAHKNQNRVYCLIRSHRPIRLIVCGFVNDFLEKIARQRTMPPSLGVRVNKRSTGARVGRTGPARSAVFAQDAANKKNERKNHTLNGSWRHRKRLCVTVPPRYVCYVEDRRPTERAGVEYRKYRLEVAIQVTRRNCPAT
jgi:hypothetical protein